eukprot:scaffold23789_cov75-Phaeocystis_antarctica.AAC.1
MSARVHAHQCTVTQTSGVANALLPHGLFQHATPTAAKGLLSASPGARLSPRRRFNLVRLRSDLACILPGYARHSAAQRPTSSFVFPISFTGRESSESERLHATYRALASPLRIRRVSAVTLRAAAAPAPRLRAPPDLRPA